MASRTFIHPTKNALCSGILLNFPATQVQLTLAGLPFDQWCHCLTIKRVMDIESTEYIVYDSQVLRTSIGDGYIKMISLIAVGLIERVLIKKVDRLPGGFMQLLIALCQERNTEIVSVQDYERDIQLIAELRQEANRTTPSIINEALASTKSWDEQTRMIRDSNRKLHSVGKGWKSRGTKR
jgi:hypothetical protein